MRADAQSKIKTLCGRIQEILAPTDREERLRADCNLNCAAVADTASGRTVSEELDAIANAKSAALDRVKVEIEKSLDDYIEHTTQTSDPNLDSAALAKDLRLILQGEAAHPPTTFVLRSPKGSSLLVFYGLQTGSSTSTTLRAFISGAKSLELSDSTGSDMDDYGNLEVKELPSPGADEIWLLVSGQRYGANGPNIRMRVFAYDGRKFRTMWMPANQWGWFTTRVTQGGFTVEGDYYRSNQHRHEAYVLTPDGVYMKQPPEKQQ